MDKIKQWLEENQIYDYEIIDNKYFVGRHSVIFGKRIRGGTIFGDWCDFDVCCGNSEILLDKVKDLYSKKVKKNMAEGKYPNTDLKSISLIKPIFNDPDYMKWIGELAEELK